MNFEKIPPKTCEFIATDGHFIHLWTGGERWQKLAFFNTETDHKVLHKIGLEIEKGVQVYLGEFAIFTKRLFEK